MSRQQRIIEADLTWTGRQFRGFEPGVRVAIDTNGTIAAMGEVEGATTDRLEGLALLPGMVNAHSHAFQRGLRGRGETFPPPDGAGSFWTWREAMYALVESTDEAKMYALALQAFREMLAAGITTVGEFHYLHHDARQAGYALDEVVPRAARDAGIRMALLQCYYNTGAVNQPLKGGQLRFRTKSVTEYWAQFDRLHAMLDARTQSLGVAPHSIRAAAIEDIAALHEGACRRGVPFHMHVEEQPREIEECMAAYHKTPMALLNARVPVNPRITAVHCTQTAAADMDDYLAAGGNVCMIPLTEANLGDGIADVPAILKRGGRICLGTDSNARISFTEEMRWLEYVQRLARQCRGVCVDERGDNPWKLWEMATVNGARSLGVKAGAIAPGHCADFIAIDLDSTSLSGWTEETLLASFILGTGNEAIARVCVGGTWIESQAAGKPSSLKPTADSR